MNTILFKSYQQVPPERRQDVTYGIIVCDYRSHKEEPHRTRFIVGGNQIEYPGDVSAPTSDMPTNNMLINSTLSTPISKYMCTDIKNFYLGTPMEKFKYTRLKLDIIPEEITRIYNLKTIKIKR